MQKYINYKNNETNHFKNVCRTLVVLTAICMSACNIKENAKFSTKIGQRISNKKNTKNKKKHHTGKRKKIKSQKLGSNSENQKVKQSESKIGKLYNPKIRSKKHINKQNVTGDKSKNSKILIFLFKLYDKLSYLSLNKTLPDSKMLNVAIGGMAFIALQFTVKFMISVISSLLCDKPTEQNQGNDDKIDKPKKQIKENEKTIDDLNKQKDKDQKTIDDLNKQKNENEKTINDLRIELKEQKDKDQKTIDDLNKQKNEDQKIINKFKKKLKEQKDKDQKTIDDLKEQKDKDQKIINDLKEQKNEDQIKITRLNKQKNEDEETIKELKNQKSQDQKTIIQLEEASRRKDSRNYIKRNNSMTEHYQEFVEDIIAYKKGTGLVFSNLKNKDEISVIDFINALAKVWCQKCKNDRLLCNLTASWDE